MCFLWHICGFTVHPIIGRHWHVTWQPWSTRPGNGETECVFDQISPKPASSPGGYVTSCKRPRSTHRWTRLSSTSFSLSILPGGAIHAAPGNICAASWRKCEISCNGQLWALAYLLFCWSFWFDGQDWTHCPRHTGADWGRFCITLSICEGTLTSWPS